VTKFVSTVAVVFLGVAAVAVVAPRLAVLVHQLVPAILVAGMVAAVLRLVWFYTQR
jgi:hypothetical protein